MAALSQPPIITEEEWERHKSTIISLYLGTARDVDGSLQDDVLQTKGLTLDKLVQSLGDYHGFTAKASQIEAKLKAWGARKNLKPDEWKPILETLDSLPRGTKSRVVIGSYGYIAPRSQVTRARKYYRDQHRKGLARIEVLGSNARWVELSNHQVILERGGLSSGATGGSRYPDTTVSQALEPAPAIPQQLEVSAHNNHLLSNLGVSFAGLAQEAMPSVPILIGHPSTWLEELPSRPLVKLVTDMKIRQRVPDIFHVTSPDYRFHPKENQNIMAPDNRYRLNFMNYFLVAITSGVYNLNNIPEDALNGCLGSNGALNSLLLSCFKATSKHVAETLASSLFEASIHYGKRDIVAQLLKEGLGHANNNVIFKHPTRWTPSEVAARLGHEGVLDVLLSYGADPNKTYSDKGVLRLIFDERPYYNPSIYILRKLLDSGAIVPSGGLGAYNMTEEHATLIAAYVAPSQHETFFRGQWAETIPACSDEAGADLVNRLMLDCTESHSGRCISLYQKEILNGLVLAAGKGHRAKFLAIFSHCTPLPAGVKEKLLSASISGHHPIIIDFVLSMKPNLNPPVYDWTKARIDVETPLAKSIMEKNTELIDLFLSADILSSLHEGGRLENAIEAAVQVEDHDLVARLLNSCPDLESHDLQRALSLSIKTNCESITLTLLKNGASFYEGERFRSPDLGSFLLQAIRGGMLLASQSLLLFGQSRYRGPSGQFGEETLSHLVLLENLSITEGYLSAFHGNFRYTIDKDIILDRLDPQWLDLYGHHSPSSRYLFKYLLTALRDETMLRFILNSKLATVQFLTACLAVVVSRGHAEIAQKLIEKGANAADEKVLLCSIRWHPELFLTLVNGANQPRNLITKGLRTDVLKEVIMEGPTREELVHYYIKLGSADIFDTGPGLIASTDGAILTPLGVAIDQAKFYPDYSYCLVKLLLDYSCDPNSIVSFQEWCGVHLNKTAMVQAVTAGSQNLVQLLIARGAHVNPELRHMVRRTPLQQAAEEGDLAMARLLIAQGANVNAPPHAAMGGTALQFAAISGNCELAADLIQHGALLHMPPPKIGGRWPIEGAAEHGRLDMIQFLWTANQNMFFVEQETGFQPKNLKKAMRLAAENGHFTCRDFIAELTGLPVTATDIPPIVSPLYVDWPPPGRRMG
ncbi:ankyrin [Xylaria arbuscula]|nr:ankyrin [Xylaria arbuscula]